MKLGIGSHSYGWKTGVIGFIPEKPMTPGELIEKANLLKVKAIQIADNMPLHSMNNNELKTIMFEAKKKDISIELGMKGLFPDMLDRYIEIATIINSKFLRVVIDSENYTPTIAQIISILSSFKSILSDKNIILGIENHDRLDSASLVKILNSLNSDAVGICLDTANSLGAGEGIDTVLNLLGPWVVNLHIKDFIIRRINYKMGFIVEGSPAGSGQLNIPKMLETLSKFNKNNISAIVELWTPPEDTLDETILKEDKWVSQSIKYLRKFITQ